MAMLTSEIYLKIALPDEFRRWTGVSTREVATQGTVDEIQLGEPREEEEEIRGPEKPLPSSFLLATNTSGTKSTL